MTEHDFTTRLVVDQTPIATAFDQAGAPVIAVCRTKTTSPELTHSPGSIRQEIADAAHATVPASLLDRYDPQTVCLVAGASPHMRAARRALSPANERRQS